MFLLLSYYLYKIYTLYSFTVELMFIIVQEWLRGQVFSEKNTQICSAFKPKQIPLLHCEVTSFSICRLELLYFHLDFNHPESSFVIL